MDYVVGGVAALISGNVTPNRPKLLIKALTPIKHQPSPNVTPKSELVDDRSIFLSPSVQKKKAIVKKSPKRIFQNPDLDVTCDGETKCSPKADKVKKHLQEDLEDDNLHHSSATVKDSETKSKKSKDKSLLEKTVICQSANENTPKKKKKRSSMIAEVNVETNSTHKRNKIQERDETVNNEEVCIKKSSLKDKSATQNITESVENVTVLSPQKKNKKKKVKSNKPNDQIKSEMETELANNENIQITKKCKRKKEKSTIVNPNAITSKDTDSEHESDNEIVSEDEEANKEILDTGLADESSDEEAEEEKKIDIEKPIKVQTENEIKRTLFVGNVPFSKKCKKEIKRIFIKYGTIETVRIRTIPVKDARMTPKLAVIKNELHPERTTVNAYVKFQDANSIEKALAENNTVLYGCHLRVSRSDTTGAEHDPRNAVFVGNMPFALEDDALREKFAKCGEIVSVRIIRDKKTNAGKGFGYVNFASKDGVELALALSEEDLTIKNRILRVKRCTQLTQRQQNRNDKKNFNNQGNQGRISHQHMQGKNKFGGKVHKQWGQKEGEMSVGAQRRIMNKRKNQDTSDGPNNKRSKYLNQPQKEKKVRKEFVGMTAEKKKKHIFNKGQKKKKALSEILTK